MTPMSEDGWGDVVDEATCVHSYDNQAIIDDLLDQGFRWQEAINLMVFRERVEEFDLAECYERFVIQNRARLEFYRWLYWNGLLQS